MDGRRSAVLRKDAGMEVEECECGEGDEFGREEVAEVDYNAEVVGMRWKGGPMGEGCASGRRGMEDGEVGSV